MKLTYRQILGSVQAFRELQDLKLPPRTSLDIYKMGKELERELKTHKDMTDAIYRHHGVPENEQGFNIEAFDEKKVPALIKDLEELQTSDTDVKDYEIDINIFERFDVPISASMLSNLDWFIKDKTEVPVVEPTPEELPIEEPEKVKAKRAR